MIGNEKKVKNASLTVLTRLLLSIGAALLVSLSIYKFIEYVNPIDFKTYLKIDILIVFGILVFYFINYFHKSVFPLGWHAHELGYVLEECKKTMHNVISILIWTIIGHISSFVAINMGIYYIIALVKPITIDTYWQFAFPMNVGQAVILFVTIYRNIFNRINDIDKFMKKKIKEEA